MTVDQPLSELHIRFALGEPLTPPEEEALAAWYREQDQFELDQLGGAHLLSAGDLNSQLDTALRQLRITAQQVHDLTLQNETLRREIVTLQQQLQRTPQAQPV